MAESGFVHLHTHSEYSILDGASRVNDIITSAVHNGSSAVALTDHGVMYGNIKFYKAAMAAGIKPILGCEVYVAQRSRFQKDPKLDREQFHLVLLAKTETGYKNLIKLVSAAFSEGFYYKPRIDKELLREYSQDLIGMSACIGGEIPHYILQGNLAQAERSLNDYTSIFGKEDFYIEMQDHGLPEQHKANSELIRLAYEHGVKLVATNDSHYTTRADAEAHDVLLCIQTGRTVSDPGRMRFGTNEFYIKSPEEMRTLFAHCPEAISNTLEIADKCNCVFDFDTLRLPNPGVPEGVTPADFMERHTREGLAKRLGGKIPDAYIKQLEYECGIINQCGFALYMLIVKDFTDFARQNGIYIGVRGSAAGSIVCYGLGITDVDPIEYGLTFERFLNPERIELPDVDLDIQDDRRDELIQYVCNKYGRDRVGQIATFGSMKARAAVRDCGRALGVDLATVDRVCKMIPTLPIGITIEKAMGETPELAKLYKSEPEIHRLIDTAKTLEGINRNVGVHAAGVLIAEEPLTNHVPVQHGGKGEIVAQMDKKDIGEVGLLKMDFLGLVNLTTLAETVNTVKRNRDVDIDILNIPLDEPKTYEMLGKGDTSGVFQLESPGMRRNVIELQPNSVRELAAIVALYRPGPMAFIPKFIKSKFGQEPIKYLHKDLEQILAETYGVICYQDQVLWIARAIAGFSLGMADKIRKAMSSKDKATMDKQKELFIRGALDNGVSAQIATKIYEQVEPFAGYAFNKAHAVCYAFVAYRTAYMKANYPVEYYAALLSANMDDKAKLALYIDDCKRLGIPMLSPDVNRCCVRFEAEGDSIKFGLGAVKGSGKAIIEGMVLARETGGDFRDLVDFCKRTMDQASITRSAVESLIKVGAFDSIHNNRAQLLEMVGDAMSAAASAKRDQTNGQCGLFGDDDEASGCTLDLRKYEHVSEFEADQILGFEKDLLGIYLSGHPLDSIRDFLVTRCTANAQNYTEMDKDQECTVGGIVRDVRVRTTKRGDRMASFKVEDLYGVIPVTAFSNAYKTSSEQIVEDNVVLVKGRATHRERINTSDDEDAVVEVEILLESISSVSGVTVNGSTAPDNRAIHIRINGEPMSKLDLLNNLLDANPGESPVFLYLCHDGSRQTISTSQRVEVSPRLIATLERLLGKDRLRIQ